MSNTKVLKLDAIRTVARAAGITNDAAKAAIDAYVAFIRETIMDGNSYQIQNFGTFTSVVSKPRLVRDFNTGDTYMSNPRHKPKFTYASEIKKLLASKKVEE